jgi:hypothetical protein
MSNRWKDERVAYVFGFQLRGRIPPAQFQYLLFTLLFDFSPVLQLFHAKLVAMG